MNRIAIWDFIFCKSGQARIIIGVDEDLLTMSISGGKFWQVPNPLFV